MVVARPLYFGDLRRIVTMKNGAKGLPEWRLEDQGESLI